MHDVIKSPIHINQFLRLFFERHQQKVAEMHASFSATTVMDEKTEKVTFWVMCFLFILLGYFSGRERTFAYKSHWFRNYYHNLESNKFSSSISYGHWDLKDLNTNVKINLSTTPRKITHSPLQVVSFLDWLWEELEADPLLAAANPEQRDEARIAVERAVFSQVKHF